MIEERITLFFQSGIHADADGVVDLDTFTGRVHRWYAEATVGTQHDPRAWESRSQSAGQIRHVVIGSQRRVGRAMQEADHHHQVVFGAGDRPRQVLVLVVLTVKEGQLLITVRWVIERIDVERDLRRRLLIRSDELVNEDVLQPT